MELHPNLLSKMLLKQDNIEKLNGLFLKDRRALEGDKMSLKIDMEILFNGRGNQDNFTTQLIKLILKADGNNRNKLALGFPNAVTTVNHYVQTGKILDLPED